MSSQTFKFHKSKNNTSFFTHNNYLFKNNIMRVLEAREIGHGILVEHDGYLSPDDNKGILKEMTSDNFGGEIYMNAILQNTTHQIETVEYTQNQF